MILCFALVELYNQEEKERDCNMQFDRQNGGNKTLDPEESKSFTAGLVFEPIKNLAFTLDYFNIEVDKQIATLSETAILMTQ